MHLHYKSWCTVKLHVSLKFSMISLSWTALHSAKPLSSVIQRVGYQGADMYLDGWGITMHIPPGAIKPGFSSDVTLSIVNDRPDSDSEERESFICLGVECSPPDLVFSHPAKIILPHSVSIPSASDVYTEVTSYKRCSSYGMHDSHLSHEWTVLSKCLYDLQVDNNVLC